MTSRNKRRPSTADEDFYSSLAAGTSDNGDSDVSDADVDALTKALADMDDMDDALFSSSLKKKPSAASKKEEKKDAKTIENDELVSSGSLGGTQSPRKGRSEAGSFGNKTFTLKDDTSYDSPSPKPQEKKPAAKKPISKTFDFGDFDEDDPLAGLLSDEEEEKSKPKQKPKPKPSATKAKTETKEEEKDIKIDKNTIVMPQKIAESDNVAGQHTEDVKQPAPASRPRSAPLPRKNDDLDFGDDDILGGMGFDESPRTKRKGDSKDEEEIQAAKSKVADLFGKSTKASPPEKPPAGRTRDFVLDPKYKKPEKGKRASLPRSSGGDEEDFTFGSYTPSAGMSRPGSAPPGRRSVRFADDGDLFGGSSTLDRPSKGKSGTSTKNPPSILSKTLPEHGTKAGKGGSDDDWLSLAIGGDAQKKPQKEEDRSKVDPLSQGETRKLERRGSRRESEDLLMDKEVTEKRPASAADYLGLGDDIDLDTLISSKPASPTKDGTQSAMAGEDSMSFPWEQKNAPHLGRRASGLDTLDTSADLGSTFDSKLLGTLSNEDDFPEEEESLNSSLIAQQISQLAKMEEEDQARAEGGPEMANQQNRSASLPVAMNTQPVSGEALRPNLRRQSNIVAGSRSDALSVSSDQTDVSRTGRTNQQGTAKKEPLWRQELKLRQQQQQQQDMPSLSKTLPPSIQTTASTSLPTQVPAPGYAKDVQPGVSPHSSVPQTSVFQTSVTQAGIPQVPVPQVPMPQASLPPSHVPLQQSTNLWQEQLAQQEEQAKNFELALKEQQLRMKEQQEAQLKQMQQLQQGAMQQQLQMQQQMMQAQTVTPNPMMSFGSQPFHGSFIPSGFDMRVKELLEEKKYLEQSLQSLQAQHKQQLEIKEVAHKEYVQLLEDSFKKKEARLLQENQDLEQRYKERLQSLAAERTRLQEDHQGEIKGVRDDVVRQKESLMESHRTELDSLRQLHQSELEQVRASMQQELQAVSQAQGHTRSLQAVVDQVGSVGQELGSLQNKLSGQHQVQLDRQRTELEHKTKQLNELQKHLESQQESMSEERARLEAVVNRLEAHIRHQNTQLDQERWRLRQEQTKLSSLQKATEEDRHISAEQVANQQVSLQQAKDSLLTDQQANIAQIMDERKTLAEERAQLIMMRKEVEASIKSNTEKSAKEQAERDGIKQQLFEDKHEISLQMEGLKKQREELQQETRRLDKQQADVEREQEKLQGMAERLRLRAQQIEEAVQDAVKVKEEGDAALTEAEMIASEHHNREFEIQEQLRILKETQKDLTQERLQLAEEQRVTQQLSANGLCVSCQRSVLRVGDTGEGLILPSGIPIQPYSSTSRYQPINSSAPHTTFDLIPRREGDKEQMVDKLLHKAELDHTVSVWRLAAEKDKDFLEEESSFLNSLRQSSSSQR